jgi:hypothetical protein
MDFTRPRNERRNKVRFAIQREVRYKLAEDGIAVSTGSGHTINMGSGGVAFGTESQLAQGGYVELSISWPVLLDESCPMRLIVFGRVLRSTGRKAVCSIEKYEFRTQARTYQQTTTIRTDTMLQRWADGIRKENLRTSLVGV